jgi:hypothetical protein
MYIAVATYPRLYVRPMEKHELELVTSTFTMSCNVLLHDCTRHRKATFQFVEVWLQYSASYTTVKICLYGNAYEVNCSLHMFTLCKKVNNVDAVHLHMPTIIFEDVES